jgi:cytochrome c
MAGLLKAGLGAAVAASLAATAAHAGGDAAKGQSLFVRCAVCHTAQQGAPNRIGPNLFRVVGRKAGTVAGYSYSSAMTRSGIVWGADTLPHYLMGPSGVVPGTKMTFAGLSSQQQADDMAAYLASLK